jgi:hypothetical protein
VRVSLFTSAEVSSARCYSFAFGNTLEALRALVFGKKTMGQPSDPPLDRRTGQGRVDATPGHYHDALAKGNIVHLLATESTGALSPDVIRLLREISPRPPRAPAGTTPLCTGSAAPRPSPSSPTTSLPSPPPLFAQMRAPSATTLRP